MTPEDDAWSQTLITVTPEDDATLREISEAATIASASDAALTLNADEIVYRRSVTDRQFVEVEDAEKEAEAGADTREQIVTQDAENQTYLQGVPDVRVSIEKKDEASQTMYMSSPCPPLKYYRDIMSSMKEGPLPAVKTTTTTDTIISINPETPQHIAIEQLSTDVTEQDLEEFETQLTENEETEVQIRDILHFALARAFWVVDPKNQAPVKTADKEAQTCIKYNNQTKTFIIDTEIQTELTCEPKKSNANLLADYWETRKMMLKYLEETLFTGLDTRIAINEILDEIIDKCSSLIKYPMKDQITQTVASYKLDGEKEEDVLRKLRLDVIVDPFEASIAVVPLMDDLLGTVCSCVSKNAPERVQKVLNAVLQRTMSIITKLEELQREMKPKPIEQILEQRRKRILDSMLTKKTGTISTQTSIAGVDEVKKIKESKEVVCSVCRQYSVCEYCTERETEDAQQQEFKPLRTQDILLAYTPCYIVTKASEKEKNLELGGDVVEKRPPPMLPAFLPSIAEVSKKSSDTINVHLQSDEKVTAKESVNEWSHVIEATMMKLCPDKESAGRPTESSMGSSSPCLRINTLSETVNALQILKKTFCNQENCTVSLHNLERGCFCKENPSYTSLSTSSTSNAIFEQEICCTQQSCKPFSKLHLPKTMAYCNSNCPPTSMKSRGDGFKIIPISLSNDSDT